MQLSNYNKVLLIDTHSNIVNIVLKINENIITKQSDGNTSNHSEYTLSMIEEILSESGFKIEDIDRICVVNGPGSFTGVRIGVVIAKTIAYLLNKDICSITSLDLKYFSNNKLPGYYLEEEKNGYYLCSYSDTGNNDIRYLSKSEFEDEKTNISFNLVDEINYENVFNYINNVDNTDSKLVNPIYIKKIEALRDK